MRVDGKVAVVTGGSRGIGQATAAGLLASGAVGVVITGRKPENLEASVAELLAQGIPSDRLYAVTARADRDEDAARAVDLRQLCVASY